MPWIMALKTTPLVRGSSFHRCVYFNSNSVNPLRNEAADMHKHICLAYDAACPLN